MYRADRPGTGERNALGGYQPVPIVSLGGTDARLWRYRNVPAYVYGPPPTGMGTYNEYVEIETFLHVVRCHVLSAYDYLSHAAASYSVSSNTVQLKPALFSVTLAVTC